MDCIYSGLSEGAFMSIEQQKIFAKPPQSYWMASTPKANYPTLEEDIKVDVAIIGGVSPVSPLPTCLAKPA